MGEGSEPFTEQAPDVSDRRLMIVMATLIVTGTLVGTLAVSGLFGMGIAVGGLLAFLNYRWQRRSLRSMFARVADGGSPGFPAAGYILRYVVIGSVVGFFYVTGALSVAAVIIGLAAFSFAVVGDGLIRIFTSSYQKEI